MKMKPAALTAEQLATALKPEFGADTNVYLSNIKLQRQADVLVGGTTAANTGTLKLNAAAALLVAGEDLVLRVKDSTQSYNGLAITVTLGVTLDDDTADTATATLTIPAWEGDTGTAVPLGLSDDFTPDGVGNETKKVKSIDSVDTVANAKPGISLEIWSTPDAAAWVGVGCKTEINGAPKGNPTVAIACGYDSNAFTKKGRGEAPTLDISYKYKTYVSGLARYHGQDVDVRVDAVKEGEELLERWIYTGYRPALTLPRGDGEEEVIGSSSGMYQALFVFLADKAA